MLVKIIQNPEHPIHAEHPNMYQPLRVTRNAASSHNYSFNLVRCDTVLLSRCFLPTTTRSWNDLPSEVVECSDHQKFKVGATKFLLNRHT